MSKILVIEDEAQLRERMVRVLSYEGYAAFGAEDGIQGLAMVEQWSPGVIIADVLMPNLDGYDLISILRSQRETRLTPIVVVTAVPERAAHRRLMELGADDCITKPFSLDELLGSVRAQFRKAGWRDKAPSQHCDWIFAFGPWRFDAKHRLLSHEDGHQYLLQLREAQLLRVLVENANTVIGKDVLAELMGKRASPATALRIDILVSELRRKLEDDPEQPRLLRNLSAHDYFFEAETRVLGKNRRNGALSDRV